MKNQASSASYSRDYIRVASVDSRACEVTTCFMSDRLPATKVAGMSSGASSASRQLQYPPMTPPFPNHDHSSFLLACPWDDYSSGRVIRLTSRKGFMSRAVRLGSRCSCSSRSMAVSEFLCSLELKRLSPYRLREGRWEGVGLWMEARESFIFIVVGMNRNKFIYSSPTTLLHSNSIPRPLGTVQSLPESVLPPDVVGQAGVEASLDVRGVNRGAVLVCRELAAEWAT